ncbi:quinoprotein relay system zinc metallohydrolase 2 [Methylobacterium sp.]|jgi:quinoprotein relay system zinc metallohydrolase 2|uniref:quinoprotein relay system zinc metallohydrolase 2 n=1 Tax=Methylobacterium sp. TaxID=409 RepID=UPI002633C364|nr:quinoprotein relay system zinc metallohydrolase 2 [Methylobacterium sp.]MDB5645302.1 quinoprotein relay system zinc metallohydrolase 2 [Methylobacterium sp.]
MRADAARAGTRWSGATRRGALFGGLCLCCLPTLGRSAEGFDLAEVGPGIFIRRGPDAEATAENNDAIANIGFIVGDRSVLVTESGGSLADGAWLRAEIARRTDKPVSHVVLTHVHPDHCFGAAAFAEDKPVYVGHSALRPALDARGEYYRARLAEILGPEKAGRVVYPTLEVGTEAEVDLGGRILRFTAHGAAHTTCDLSMRDSASGILFPADLLFVTRIPSLDGSLNGWLMEAEKLKAMGAAKAVPGHGPTLVDLVPALDDLTRYLTTLRDETRTAIAADTPIEKAVQTVGRAERDRWALFDTYHGRNVTQAFKELEWE